MEVKLYPYVTFFENYIGFSLKKTIVYFMLIITTFVFLVPSVCAQTSGTMTINYAADQGQVTYRASGFIGISSNTQPPDSLYLPLKPQMISWVRGYSSINRAISGDMIYQTKLLNMGLIPSSPTGDWSSWENLVYNTALTAKNAGYPNVEFDIWNEPEFSGYWSGPIDERYFQMWIRAYRIIKSVDPMFVVAGPSSTDVTWTLQTFLPRMKIENALPNVLTWHALGGGGGGVSTTAETIRTYLINNNMNISKLSLNEYDSADLARKPGIIARYMYELEKAKIDSAAKACWPEGGDWNCEVHLDNLLTYPDQQKRSVWWTYKAYADMTGTLVTVTNPTGIVPGGKTADIAVGLASKDSSSQTGRVLIGNLEQNSTIAVTLQNLSSAPFYSAGQSIKATIYRIPNTEELPLTAPQLMQTVILNSANQSVNLPAIAADAYEVYTVFLEPASLTTQLGDANGDGHVNNLDFLIWKNNFGQNVSGVRFADFDNSGKVDGRDFIIWLFNYGQ